MKPTYETTVINQRKMQKIAFNLTFNDLKIIYHRELIVHLQIDYTTILGPQIFYLPFILQETEWQQFWPLFLIWWLKKLVKKYTRKHFSSDKLCGAIQTF